MYFSVKWLYKGGFVLNTSCSQQYTLENINTALNLVLHVELGGTLLGLLFKWKQLQESSQQVQGLAH